MSKIIYDSNMIKIMNSFGAMTRAKLKDFITEDDKLIFIVEEGELGKAVGKKASNVKKLENYFKKKIKIVEFHDDKLRFIQAFIYPLRVKEIHEEEEIVVIVGPDAQTKGLLIGKNAANLRKLEDYVKRYFDVKEIKVL
ncbi:NusA-like transcription termination signal-binding factor [Nanoarchaeota archaeon]